MTQTQIPSRADTSRRISLSIRELLANPLVGLSPWILYAIVEWKGRLELSAALALGLAVVIVSANWLLGSSPKLLEFSDVTYFAGLAYWWHSRVRGHAAGSNSGVVRVANVALG